MATGSEILRSRGRGTRFVLMAAVVGAGATLAGLAIAQDQPGPTFPTPANPAPAYPVPAVPPGPATPQSLPAQQYPQYPQYPQPAQSPGDPQAPGQAPGQASGQLPGQPPQQQTLSQGELDTLVAPIALYPDSLLSQILMASTYPLEVVQAQRFTSSNPQLQGDPLAGALAQQSWDPSVKSLVNFPTVLDMMNDKLDWTVQLGNAFLSQQPDVMTAVQRLRVQAQTAGNLQTNEQQRIETVPADPNAGAVSTTQYIVIDNTSPDYTYVPVYDPSVVYGTWRYPNYRPYFWHPREYQPTRGIWWGPRRPYGPGWGYAWGQPDWQRQDIDLDIRRHEAIKIREDRSEIIRRERDLPQYGDRYEWRHDPRHRDGIVYSSPAVAERYGGRAAPDVVRQREQYRGRTDGGAQHDDKNDRRSDDRHNDDRRSDDRRDNQSDKRNDARAVDGNVGRGDQRDLPRTSDGGVNRNNIRDIQRDDKGGVSRENVRDSDRSKTVNPSADPAKRDQVPREQAPREQAPREQQRANPQQSRDRQPSPDRQKEQTVTPPQRMPEAKPQPPAAAPPKPAPAPTPAPTPAPKAARKADPAPQNDPHSDPRPSRPVDPHTTPPQGSGVRGNGDARTDSGRADNPKSDSARGRESRAAPAAPSSPPAEAPRGGNSSDGGKANGGSSGSSGGKGGKR